MGLSTIDNSMFLNKGKGEKPTEKLVEKKKDEKKPSGTASSAGSVKTQPTGGSSPSQQVDGNLQYQWSGAATASPAINTDVNYMSPVTEAPTLKVSPVFTNFNSTWDSFGKQDQLVKSLDQQNSKKRDSWYSSNNTSVLSIAQSIDPTVKGKGYKAAQAVLDKTQPWLTTQEKTSFINEQKKLNDLRTSAMSLKNDNTFLTSLEQELFNSYVYVDTQRYNGSKLENVEGYFKYDAEEVKKHGHLMYYTKKGENDVVLDADKIRSQARKIAADYGFSENSPFATQVESTLRAEVENTLWKRKTDEEFTKLFKAQYGLTPVEYADKLELENKAAFEKAFLESNEYQQIKNKVGSELTAYNNTLIQQRDEEIKQMDAEFKRSWSLVESKIQNDPKVTAYANSIIEAERSRLLAEIAAGKMNEDQAIEYLNSPTFQENLNKKVDEFWRSSEMYGPVVEQMEQDYLSQVNELNTRYSNSANKFQDQVEAKYKKQLTMASSAVAKRFDEAGLDPKEISKLYQQAGKNVWEKRRAEHSIKESQRSWLENFTNSFQSALGGSVKRLGIAVGSKDIEAWGDQLEIENFSLTDPTFNSLSDITDKTKSANYAGSMVGGMFISTAGTVLAGLITAPMGGWGAAAFSSALAGFTLETTDLATDAEQRVLENTGGDLTAARNASNEVVKAQVNIMGAYTLEWLPFTDVKFIKNVFGKVLFQGAIESASETFVELKQNESESIIDFYSNNPGSKTYEGKSIFEIDGDKVLNTVLNVAPLTFAMGGGPSLVQGGYTLSKDMYYEAKARSMMAKGDISLSGLGEQTLAQQLYSTYSKAKKNTTVSMVNIAFGSGQIDAKTRDNMLAMIDSFEKLDASHASLGVKDNDVMMKTASVKLYSDMEGIRRKLDETDDPLTRQALTEQLKKAESSWLGLFSGQQPDLFVVQLADGEVYFYTPSEMETALSSDGFSSQVKEGSVIINAIGDVNNKKYSKAFSKIESLISDAPEGSWREKVEADKQAALKGEKEKSEKANSDKIDIEQNGAVPSIEEAIDSKNTFEFDGAVGTLYVEGNTVIFESSSKKTELGQIDKISDKPVSDLGIKPQEVLDVKLNDDNTLTVGGKKYVNNYSDPMAAVSVDKDGNYSVSLETDDGKKRTFRKGRAEAIVYQMKLKDLNDATEQQIDAVTKLADEALSTEIKTEQVAAEAAPEVTGEAQAVETAKAPAESGAVTPTQQQDAVQVETAGQVPVQPEATTGQEVAQGKPQAEPQAVTKEGEQGKVKPTQETAVTTEKPKGKWSPSETIKKLKERQKKFAGNNVDKAVESINKSLESSNVKAEIIESQAEWNKVTGGQARDNNGIFISQDGSGKIYINRQKLQKGFETTVVWHEGTHPVINIIRNTNKPLYDKMVKGLAKARKSATGNTKKNLDQILNWVEKEYAQDGEFTIEDESIVEVIAMIADGKLKLDEMPKSIAQTIIDFINSMAEFFGLPTVLPDTDMRTFMNTANAISEALITGKDMASIVGAENVGKFEFIKPGGQSRRVSTEQVFKREEVKKGKKKVMDVAKEFEKAVDDVVEPSADADAKMTRFLTNAYEDLRYFLSDFEGDVGLDWYTNKMREFDEKLMEASDIAIERGDMPAENSLRDPDNMDLFKAVLALSSTGENPKSNTRAAFNIWKNFNRGEMLFQKYQPGQVSLRTKVEIKTAKGEPKIDKKTGKVMYEAPSGPIIRENKRTVTIQVGNKEVTIKKSELRPAYQMEYNVIDAKGKTVVKTPEKEMRVWKETDKYFYFGTPSSKGGLLKIAKSDILMMEPVDNGITGKGWTARGGAVATNLEKLERLMEDHGGIVGAVKWLKSKHGIEQLRNYNAGVPDVNGKKGMNPEGERYGSFIFGEKLGPFHQNVSGVPTELTMDLWWSRTWNRYMGTLITKGDNEKVDIQEVPRNDAERNIMREAARLAADDLGLEVHELQAALWYMEQQMYKRMGAAVESYSFVDGINEILKNYGKKDEELRSENYGVDSTEADRKRQDAVTKLNARLAGEGVKIRKGEGGRVEVQREDGGVERQASKAKDRNVTPYAGTPTLEAAGMTTADVTKWRDNNRKTGAKKEGGKISPVQQSAQDLADGKKTIYEHIETVRKEQPTVLATSVPSMPAIKAVIAALHENKRNIGVIGVNAVIEEGRIVGLRLDIPSLSEYGVATMTVHDGSSVGNPIGYGRAGSISNVKFETNPKKALDVATGAENKAPFARMIGTWNNESEESVFQRAKEALNDPEWIQVGMNPSRHSWFFDKATGMPVMDASEVIQVGGLVLAKNARVLDLTNAKDKAEFEDKFKVKLKDGKIGQFSKAAPRGVDVKKSKNFDLDGEYSIYVDGVEAGKMWYNRSQKTWNNSEFYRSSEKPGTFKWIYGDVLGETRQEAINEIVSRYKAQKQKVRYSDDKILNEFLNELNAIAPLERNPIRGQEFIYDNKSSLEFNRFDKGDRKEISLQDISVLDKGKGLGSSVLKDITSVADKLGITLTIDVKPFGEGGLNKKDLIQFYKKNGFVADLNEYGGEFTSEQDMIDYVLEYESESLPMFRKPSKTGTTQASKAGARPTPEQYSNKLSDDKEKNPEMLWSVSEVSSNDASQGTLIFTDGGAALVDKTGDIRGLYKYPESKEKGVAARLLEQAVNNGGIKLDNFDIKTGGAPLTKIYEKAGFRLVSTLPFNDQYAPPGWNESMHGKPDVVAMIYDPDNKLDIEVKTFTKDQYMEAMEYRDSYVDAQIKAYSPDAGIQMPTRRTQQPSSSAERYGSREEMFETHKLYVDLATEAINAGVETYQEFLDGLDEVKTALSENAWRDAKRIAQGKKPMINGPEDINRGMKKSLANRAFEGGSQETVKDAIYEFGLEYDPITNESAYESASQFIDKVGVDDALLAADNGMISGSMQAFVYSIAIDRIGAEMAVETDPVRQMELISKQASIINAFDMKARDGGRFVQALNYVYKNSDFPYTYEYAIKSLVEANAGKELTTEMKGMINSLVSQIGDLTKRIKEQETKLQEAMERDAVGKIVDAVMGEKKTSKEKSSYKKIADKIREGKINRPGMFMASSPAAVAWDAALETAATIIEAGGKLADAVAEGIMRMRQSEWYKSADEKTRQDGEKVFTDYMVESSSKENLKAPVKPTVDTDGNINIPFSFLRQLVKDGVTTIEEMTSVILDTLSIDYEGITERQVRDAITKYGQQKFPSKDEVLRKLAEMKRDGQLLSALEDVESGKFPAKSGFQREKPTDKQRELTRKIKDRMKDIPEDQEQIEKNWASAQTRIKTILENRIADLNAQIAAGQREARNRKQTDLNEENKLLKAEVARLNEVLDGLVGKVEVSHETKVKNALKAIERAKDDIQDMIAKSNIGYKEKKARLEDPRLTAAREQLDAMRETLTQMREEQGIAEARRIAMYKERLKQDIKEMQRKLDEGDYAKKESKDLSMIDDEVKALRAEKLKLKNKIDIEKEKLRIENRTRLERSLDAVVDIVNIPRSLLASLDLSAPLRQGLITSLRNPKIAAAAFLESLSFAVSKVSFEKYMEALQSTPEYMVMKEAGLFLSTPSAELAAREEQFLSNLAEKIPGYGTILIAGTQRAYTGYLNKLRADVFMAFHKQLLDEGYTGAELMENLKSFAQFINESTGRGSFGKRGDAVLGNASQLFFAPRYVASRFNVLARTATLGYGMPKAARKEMLKTMGTYLGLGTLTLALAAAAGAEVEDDPRSSDFGKIKIGDLRFDIWAGNQQIVVLLSRILTMETKRTGTGEVVPFYSGGWNSQTMMSTLGDFLENKVSPPVAIFMDFDSKDNTFKFDKKFWGMELAKKGEEFNITDAILGNISPIWINDIREIYKEQGLFDATLAGLGSFFGVGVSYYGPSVKDKVQNDVYQYFNENPPGDWSSQKYMKEYRSFIEDSIIPKYEADPDFNDDILVDAERTADVLHATNGKPSWYRDAFYASTNDRRLEIIVSNTQGLSKKELEKTVNELYELGIISDEFYSKRIDPLLEK